MGEIDRFIHRHAVGAGEFENYMEWRKHRSVRSFGTVYLAFHGSQNGLQVGNETFSLENLARLIGRLPRGVVHLGSCSTLLGSENAARAFLKTTGASMITGYQRDVDWLDSAAIDTVWLGYVAYYSRLGDAARYFKTRYASVLKYLGWQSVSSTG